MRNTSLWRVSLLTIVLLLHFHSIAHAVEWTVLSPTGPMTPPAPGSVITIDLSLDNLSGDSVQAVVGELSGLAAAGVTVLGGQSASSHFVGVCFPSDCFGGIDTQDNAFFNPQDLGANGAYTPGDDTITIVLALGLGLTSSDGSLDPGLDGGLDVASARDVTLQLFVAGPNPFLLQSIMAGGFYSDGVNQISIAPVQVFTLTPEPGTAVLFGLGTIGLAATRPKSGLNSTKVRR